MDSAWGHSVWKIHGQVRCVELRRSPHGAFYLWSSSVSRCDTHYELTFLVISMYSLVLLSLMWVLILRNEQPRDDWAGINWKTSFEGFDFMPFTNRLNGDTEWPTQLTSCIQSRRPTLKRLAWLNPMCTRSCWNAGTEIHSRDPPSSSLLTCLKTSTSHHSLSIWNRYKGGAGYECLSSYRMVHSLFQIPDCLYWAKQQTIIEFALLRDNELMCCDQTVWPLLSWRIKQVINQLQ